MKNIFAKTIDTGKVDHLAVLVESLGSALQTALDAKLPLSQIAHELNRRAAHFQGMVDAAIEARSRNPYPTMYDQMTGKPIDYAGQAARAEEKRLARELREQQIAYAKSVDERGREAARREGKIL